MQDFLKNYLLYIQNNGASKNTIKNYSSDLVKYLDWFKLSGLSSKHITRSQLALFEKYLKTGTFSESSVRRILSTSKSFTEWKIENDLFEAVAVPFLLHLETKKASKNTIKNYSSDLSKFVNYVISNGLNVKKPTHITEYEIKSFKSFLNSSDLSDASKRRAVSSLTHFYAWAVSQGLISKGFKPLVTKKYKKHILPLATFKSLIYFSSLFIILFATYSFYPQVHAYTDKNVFSAVKELFSMAKGSVLGTTAPTYLSYQGRLVDNNGSPITTSTSFVFKIYDNLTGGTQKWTSGSCSITPDNDGIFDATLGNSCGPAFTPDIFADNATTFLEVTIAAETLSPRQPISSVPYAINSDSLDGLDSSSFIRSDLSDTFTGSSDQTMTFQSSLTGNRATNLLSVTQSNDATYSMSADLVSINQADTSSSGGAFYLQNLGAGISFRVDDTATDTTPFVVDNSGNVGIGTSTPAAFLDVAAATTGQASVRLQSGIAPTSPGIGDIYSDGTDLFFYDGVSWVDLTYGAGGSGSAAWSALTNPTTDLSLSMGTTSTTFNWATGTNSSNLFSYTTDASASGTGALINIQTGNSSTVLPLRVRAGVVEALYVNASGNVGIGSNSVNNKLTVTGSSDISGNLSIGTTSTSNNLHISTVSDSSIYIEADRAGSASEDNNAFIKLSQDGATVQSIIGTVGNAGFDPENVAYTGTLANSTLIGTLDSNGALQLGTNDAVRMTILTGGNVGIGSTNPGATLDVVGNGLFSSTVQGTQLISTIATGTAPITVASTTLVANLNADLLDGKQGNTFCWTDGSNCPSLPAGGGWTDSGTIIYNTTTTDNVSIGTSASLAKLTVDGDTDEIQLLVQGHSTQTNNLVVFENSAGTDLFTLSNTGVGYFAGTISASNLSGTNTGDITLAAIGATPNANAASLSGQVLNLQPANASFGGVVTTGAQTLGGAKTLNALLTTVGIANSTTAISNSAGYTQSGTSANTFTGTSTFNNATYSALFTGGNVGIGTATPGSKLTVEGTTYLGGNVNVGASGTNSRFQLYNDEDITAAPNTKGLRLTESSGDWLLSLGISGVTNTGFAIRDIAAGTYPFVIRETTGRVGINTSGPSSQLEVNGDIELSNLLDNDASNFFDGGCSGTETVSSISSTGAITCTAITGVPAGGGWTDSGTIIYNTTTTDNVSIGTSASLAKLTVDGDTDEIQLLIQGHSTQTNNLVVFENSAGTDLFTLTNAGNGVFAGDLTVSGGDLYLNDTNTRLTEGSGNALRMQTNSGYIDIGPQNTSYAHLQTDRPSFYLNKRLTVDEGIVGSYDEDLILQRAGATKLTLASSLSTFVDSVALDGSVLYLANSSPFEVNYFNGNEKRHFLEIHNNAEATANNAWQKIASWTFATGNTYRRKAFKISARNYSDDNFYGETEVYGYAYTHPTGGDMKVWKHEKHVSSPSYNPNFKIVRASGVYNNANVITYELYVQWDVFWQEGFDIEAIENGYNTGAITWYTNDTYTLTEPTGLESDKADTPQIAFGDDLIGIGTDSPAASIDILNTGAVGLQVNSDYGSDHWPLRVETNGANYSGFWETSDDIRLLLRDNSGNVDIDLRPDGVSYINGGNFAIGSTSASSTLEVSGDIELTNLLDNDASNFFDGGCSATQTVSGISANGAISCISISGVPSSDADTLDGIDSTQFIRKDIDQTITNLAVETSFYSGTSINTATSDQATLEVYEGTVNEDAFMQFHVGGDYAVYFGLDGGINDLAVGGWSMGANSYRIWHEGNDGIGSTLNADLLDDMNQTSAATANTIVSRNGNADFSGRYINSSYFNTSHSQSTRNSDTIFYSSTDNYIRKNNQAGMLSSLGLTAGGAGDIWVEKAGDTMTGDLSLTGAGVYQDGYLNLNSDNILYNGDFETNTDEGWTGVDFISTQAYSGNFAAQIDGQSTVYSSDYIPVDPNYDVIQLEGYIRKYAAGTTPGVTYFGYYAYNSSKTVITTSPCGTYCYFAASNNVIPVDGNYHKFNATTTGEGTSYPNFPVGTKFIRVLLLANWGGSANAITLLDHVSIKKISNGPLFVGNNYSATNMRDQFQVSKLYTNTSNNLVLEPAGSNVDIGSATTGLRIGSNGYINDIDGSLVLNDQTYIGSASTGLLITTGGALNDVDGNLILNDTTDIGSASTGLRISTAGGISDIDGAYVAISDGLTTTGSVGIGISNPSTDLHVSASTGTPEIRVSSTTGGVNPTLSVVNDPTSPTEGLKIWQDISLGYTYFDALYDVAGSPSIYFRTRVSGTPVNALTIYGNGNVGIGTTSPEGTLDIYGGPTTTYNITATNPSLVVGQPTANNRGYIEIWGTTASSYGVIQMTTNNLHLDSSTAGIMYLNHYAGTNVVIGNSTTGLNFTSAGVLNDIDGNLRINDTVEVTNLFDYADSTNFFDGGCSATQTVSGISANGAISCISISGVPSSDADTLDGIDSTQFIRNDIDQTITNLAVETSFYSGTSINTATVDQATLEVYEGTIGEDAFMQFHVGGDYAVYFGLDGGINDLAVGGWSMGANSYRIWHQGNDGTGSGLDADLLDGQTLTSASTINTVVGRNGSGDINARLFRSEYDTTNPTIGFIMTQIDTASNNYIRPSTPAQLVTGLGLEAGGSRDIWVEKAGDTMSGDLEFTTDAQIEKVNNANHFVVAYPEGGFYQTTTNVVTGAIEITLPVLSPGDMLKMVVDVFDYTTNESFTAIISGYPYNAAGPTPNWANTSVQIIGSRANRDVVVRFGHDGVNNKVWIGELTDSWNYPQVQIKEVWGGFQSALSSWQGAWSVGLEATAFDTVNATQTNNYTYASNLSVPTGSAPTFYINGSNVGSLSTSTLTLAGQTTLTASSLSTLTTSSAVNWGGATGLTFTADNASIYGSDIANGNLTLEGTSHATKATSYINLQPSGGNVGIGTTSAGSKLDVIATGTVARFGDTANQNRIQVRGGGAIGPSYDLVNAANNTWAITEDARSSNNLVFWYSPNGSTGWVNPLTVATTDRVGIGSTSPSYKLDIGGNLRNTTDAYFATASGSVGIGTTNTSGGTLQVLGRAGKAGVYSTTADSNPAMWAYNSSTGPGLTAYSASGGALSATTGAAVAAGVFTSLSNQYQILLWGAGYKTLDVGVDGNGFGRINQDWGLGILRGGTEIMRIGNNNGNVGIGTTGPSEALHVVGKARITNIGAGTYTALVNQDANGVLINSTSDIRFKKNVTTIDNALSKVLQLRGVTYNWKDPNSPQRMTGMIAQEVLPVMPELISTSSDGYYGLFYGETSGLLIEAVKELNAKLTEIGSLSISGAAENYIVKNNTKGTKVTGITAAEQSTIGKVYAGLTTTQDLNVTKSASVINLNVSNLTIGNKTLNNYILDVTKQLSDKVAQNNAYLTALDQKISLVEEFGDVTELTSNVFDMQNLLAQVNERTTNGTVTNSFDTVEEYEVGDVLSYKDLDTSGTQTYQKSTSQTAQMFAGVVQSERFNLGQGSTFKQNMTNYGTATVKVTTKTGIVVKGDLVAISTEEGFGDKYTNQTYVIGTALQDASYENVVLPDPNDPASAYSTGTVVVNINPQNMALASNSFDQDLSQLTVSGNTLSINYANSNFYGDVNVTGTSTVNALVATNQISTGLITIDGQDSSINALATTLQLQNKPGAGDIEIFGAKILITNDGSMSIVNTVKAKQFAVDTTQQTSATLGSAQILPGQNTVFITTTSVSVNSKIFVTPTQIDISSPLVVISKTSGSGFTVKVATASPNAIFFDWFIVQEIASN